MRTSEGIRRIVDEIEYLRAKRHQVARITPRLLLTHGHHLSGTGCQPGETIEQASLVVGVNTFPLNLSLAGLMVLDILARKKPLILTARQIERIMVSDPFCLKIGTNVPLFHRDTAKPTRRSIKVYVQRIREQLQKAFRRAGLSIHPKDVLVSEAADLANVVTYRIAIPCEFSHLHSDYKIT